MMQTQHDIQTMIERSSIDGKDGVPIEIRRSAFAAVADHPNYVAALSHLVCTAVVMHEPKTFFVRSRWPDDVKAKILDQLLDVTTVLLLSFLTSDIERTVHFTGGGVSYEFVLHPDTLSIVHAGFGSWYT